MPLLIRGLDDESSYVRSEALDALASHGPEALPALPKLVAFLNDPDASKRHGAADVICWIGPSARACTDLLDRLASDDPDPAVRECAQQALTSIRK